MRKRILAAIVMLGLCLSVANADVVLSEDFNSLAAGTAPADWVNLNGYGVTEGHEYLVTSSAHYYSASIETPSLRDELAYVVSMNMKLAGTARDLNGTLRETDYDFRIGGESGANVFAGRIKFRRVRATNPTVEISYYSNGVVTSWGTLDASVVDDEWLTVIMTFDETAKKYGFEVKNTSGTSLAAASDLAYYSTSGAVDNVRVYEERTVEPQARANYIDNMTITVPEPVTSSILAISGALAALSGKRCR